MRQDEPTNNQAPNLPGVTDTIAAGLSEVLARPWLMILPMLLDMYYWIGWRFLPTAVTNQIAEYVQDSSIGEKQTVLDTLGDAGKVDLAGIVGQFVPSVLVGVERKSVYELWSRPVVVPASTWAVALIGLAFFLGASLCFVTFLIPLADVVMKRRRPWRAFPKAVVRAWVRVLALQALLIAAGMLVFAPLAFITAVFIIAGVNLSGLLMAAVVTTVIVAYVFLWFAFVAIAGVEVGPLRAVYLSVNVVRRYFSQTMGLIVASLLIGSGLPALWQQIMDSPPGLLIAVIANAFFAVGISIATVIFFADRLRALRYDAASRAFSIAQRRTI